MYPWGDFHSLNLGWFLVQFKEWTEKIQEYLDNGGGTSENLANVIAPVFNAENSYLTGDYVLYNDELYKADQAVNPGTWDPDAWTRCLVTEEMGSGSGGVDNVARLMIAGQYSNNYNYQKYAICRYNDKLWMCNTNLPAGGEEWVPSHWDEITVGAGLTGLRRSVETLSNAITDLQNIVGNGSLTGFTATDLTGAANELMGSLNAITPFDSTPTSGSLKGVTSGGVKSAIDAANAISNLDWISPNETLVSANSLYSKKVGNILIISGYVTLNGNVAGNNAVLGSFSTLIPQGERRIYGYGAYNGAVGLYFFKVDANGQLMTATGSGTFSGTIVFPDSVTTM